jgi:uroporphyrinogen decarboxylase
MTGEQRVYGALQRQPVDRVPTFEWLISENVREALQPGATCDEFIERMDIDAAVVELDIKKTYLDDVTYRDGWGIVKQKTKEEYAVPLGGPLRDAEDLKGYAPPDYNDPSHYRRLEEALAFHKGKRAVILRLNDVFSIPSRLATSFEDFMVAIMIDPDFVRALIDITIDTYLGFAREAVKRGCRIVFTGDDYAFNSNPMMSPKVFEELFYPGLKRVMRAYKDLGLLVIKHSDGNIMPLLDMIMDTDIDCIDPIDPLGGMDLGYMKKTYGDRFCIKGNVECAGALSVGTPEQVIAETKHCLKTAMPGGGYVCSSSNSILTTVKPENYQAMLDTIKEYGVY